MYSLDSLEVTYNIKQVSITGYINSLHPKINSYITTSPFSPSLPPSQIVDLFAIFFFFFYQTKINDICKKTHFVRKIGQIPCTLEKILALTIVQARSESERVEKIKMSNKIKYLLVSLTRNEISLGDSSQLILNYGTAGEQKRQEKLNSETETNIKSCACLLTPTTTLLTVVSRRRIYIASISSVYWTLKCPSGSKPDSSDNVNVLKAALLN